MKKILYILTVCLAVAGQVFAEAFTDQQGVSYEYYGDEGTITGFDNKTRDVVITSPVKNGDDEFYVTTIAKNAFDSKTNLESIVLPKELTTIDASAFYGCKMLYKVMIPESAQLNLIADRAFAYCTSLIDITIRIRKEGTGANEVSRPTIKSNSSQFFYNFQDVPHISCINNTGRTIKGYPWGARNVNCTVDGYLLYKGDTVVLCTQAARGAVVVREGIVNIYSGSVGGFKECKNVTSIVLPASLKTCGSACFTDCTGLTSLVCKATTPPNVNHTEDIASLHAFIGVDKSIPIYVPKESIDAYKKAAGWSQFTNYQEWSQETEDQLSQCTLTLLANDDAMGSVKGAGTFESGSEVTIEAVPAEGYKFVQWSDNNAENPRKLIITGSTTLTAIFADKNASGKFILTLLVNDANMGTVTGAGEYEEGAVANIEATPKEGYVFKKWSDGNKLSRRSIMMTANLTLTAEFAAASSETPVTYTITVSANDGSMGTVTGGGTYEPNAQVTLTATPKEGFVFVKWSDGNTDNPRTLAATANANFIAIFASNSQGVEIVESQKSKVESKKVLRDGQIIIVREGIQYNTLGVKLQ